ncbi:MAG: hypothetical protein U1E53_00055 [Dongiaceae bacterium]
MPSSAPAPCTSVEVENCQAGAVEAAPGTVTDVPAVAAGGLNANSAATRPTPKSCIPRRIVPQPPDGPAPRPPGAARSG